MTQLELLNFMNTLSYGQWVSTAQIFLMLKGKMERVVISRKMQKLRQNNYVRYEYIDGLKGYKYARKHPNKKNRYTILNKSNSI